MVKRIFKWVLIVVGLGFLCFVGYIILIMSAFGVFDKEYTKQEVVENYESKKSEMLELKAYFTSIVPKNKIVKIEFDGDDELNIFHIVTLDTTINKKTFDSNWNLETESGKVDSLIATLGWTHETLKDLKTKLDNANCISVSNSDPFNIGFQRSGMGMYFYNIFDSSISDSLKEKYNDGCTYILYTDKVVLEYGGGAVGPQCFPW